jgi:hypothetical protein
MLLRARLETTSQRQEVSFMPPTTALPEESRHLSSFGVNLLSSFGVNLLSSFVQYDLVPR